MDSRVIKSPKVLPQPLTLKDYLLDELSSYSSIGFKSVPRRQCCTTAVRFLIEIDLKNNHRHHHQKQQQQKENKHLDFKKPSPPCLLMKSPSKSALASFRTVITAVKRFPFGATTPSSPEKKRLKKSSSLWRSLSFSMKIIDKSSFWRRKPDCKGIKQWRSFEQLLKEDYMEPSAISNSSTETTEFAAPAEIQNSNFSAEGGELYLAYDENDVVGMPRNGDVSIDSATGSEKASSFT